MGKATGERQFAATLMGTSQCAEVPAPPPSLVAANWHSPLLSKRRQVHGMGKATGEHQFAATLMGPNWHSPLLSERWQVYGMGKATG